MESYDSDASEILETLLEIVAMNYPLIQVIDDLGQIYQRPGFNDPVSVYAQESLSSLFIELAKMSEPATGGGRQWTDAMTDLNISLRKIMPTVSHAELRVYIASLCTLRHWRYRQRRNTRYPMPGQGFRGRNLPPAGKAELCSAH